MSIVKQFLGTLPGGEGLVLNKGAFTEFARAAYSKSASKTEADRAKNVETFNRLLSSTAGVAELATIEGDFEVLNIFRDSFVMDFAEMRNLPLGTLPIYRTRVLNPVGIFTGSLAGVGGTTYWATKDTVTQISPFSYSTERIMIPNLNNLYDMERLMQRRDGLAQLDRYDRIEMENIALNTVFATSGTDVVTTDPAAQIVTYATGGGSFSGKSVYSLDPGVVAGSVPSVNYYDLSAQLGLTKKVFQTVNTHSMQIGRNFSTMYISQAATSGNAPVWESLQNMATPVALVTGTGVNTNPAAAVPADMWSEFQKDDFRGAVVVNWFGQTIAVKKVNWFPAGYAVLFTSDHPACIVWKRLELSSGQPQEGTMVQPMDGFYSYVSKTKNIATARPDFMLRNFLVLKLQ